MKKKDLLALRSLLIETFCDPAKFRYYKLWDERTYVNSMVYENERHYFHGLIEGNRKHAEILRLIFIDILIQDLN